MGMDVARERVATDVQIPDQTTCARYVREEISLGLYAGEAFCVMP